MFPQQGQLSFPFHVSHITWNVLVPAMTISQLWGNISWLYWHGPENYPRFYALLTLLNILDQSEGFVTQTWPWAGCSSPRLLKSHSAWT